MSSQRVNNRSAKTLAVVLTAVLGGGLAAPPAQAERHDRRPHGKRASAGSTAVRPAAAAARPAQRGRKRRIARVRHNKRIALELMQRRRYGWTSARQWRCLERLWTRESGWNQRARNPSSGAHGIPQALPGRKMAIEGADWRTNPRTQIRWGLRYIKSRYGTPCGAWRHFRARNWY